MNERFITCAITNSADEIRKAMVNDTISVTTTNAAVSAFDFLVTAVNNAPVGSNVYELSGRVHYDKLWLVKAKIWIRKDEQVTYGLDSHDVARLERDVIAEQSPGEYVNFGDMARGHMYQQCQYASRFVEGQFGKPNLGKGLRFKGDVGDYHSLQIHREDAAEFVERYYTHLAAERGMSLGRYLNHYSRKLALPSDF